MQGSQVGPPLVPGGPLGVRQLRQSVRLANAFHYPIVFFTTQTNLANLMASQLQHMDQAVTPRLERRDEMLNAQLVPLYDPSGLLFLASEDPVPMHQSLSVLQQQADLKYGVVSVNEVRSERGLTLAPWGDVPWLQLNCDRRDAPRAAEEPRTGRNRRPKGRQA